VALAFGLAGLSGLPQKFTDAPWGRGIIFLAEGNTLFATLMFNFLPPHRTGIEDLADRPFWEAENPFAPVRKFPLGIMDYLTWPNRAVRLLPEPDGAGGWMVRQMTMAPGLVLASSVLDPYKHYRQDEKRGYLVLRFQESRALWRDSAALLQLREKEKETSRTPRPLVWLADLTADKVLPEHFRHLIMALGMANNQAKIDFYREEHFPVPAEYLTTPALVQQLNEALVLAEAAGSVLGRALSRLATLVLSPTADDPEGRKPDRKDVSNLVGHWGGQRAYWAALEAPFWALLLALPQDGEKALQTWRETVQREAVAAFNHVADALGETPRVLKAVARADRQLRGALFCVFHPQENVKPKAKSPKEGGDHHVFGTRTTSLCAASVGSGRRPSRVGFLAPRAGQTTGHRA